MLGRFAIQKFQGWSAFQNYTFEYFSGADDGGPTGAPSAEKAREFLNDIDRAKGQSLRDLRDSLGGKGAADPYREAHDYAFRAFRDLWFIQLQWRARNGRYFQGLPTMEHPPRLGTREPVSARTLTHQVDTWRDVGYFEKFAPVSLRSDVYDGPQGQGYVVTASFLHESETWAIYMHHGPESKRWPTPYVWARVPPVQPPHERG